MHLVKLPWHTRMDLIESSDLEKAKEIFFKNDYALRIGREINNTNFLKEFVSHFKNIESLGFQAFGDGVSYDFLYELPNLKDLSLHTMYSVNFEYLKQLQNLSMWWNKKMITNFNQLKNLETLHIIEFDEKDLTKLSKLTNLKSLSFATAKIKSLKGIETLTNLENLSLGSVRSLTDISDSTALQKLEQLEFDICWKLKDFSPIGELKALKELQLLDCKNLESIKFVKDMPNLKRLSTLGTTIINDYDTTPAEHIPVFFGSQNNKYNKQYPKKEIHKKLDEL
ncbi:hypothetical protein [Aquimarina longa]|uniref:hypothetical protein n=1 Tax=Aquimarina longa TaxID=1080221 RepID=UPI000AE7569A|nr:hypothetical protein [Aquimarina longa]